MVKQAPTPRPARPAMVRLTVEIDPAVAEAIETIRSVSGLKPTRSTIVRKALHSGLNTMLDGVLPTLRRAS